jgi:hypothetical protein
MLIQKDKTKDREAQGNKANAKNKDISRFFEKIKIRYPPSANHRLI